MSIVLPMHVETDAEHFRLALRSLTAQIAQPEEIVVVADGPLTRDHHLAFEELRNASGRVRRIDLEHKGGISRALNIGMESAEGTWVARMDGDDIALPTRLARQLESLRTEPVDVLGSAVTEFEDDPAQPTNHRHMPETHEAIVRMMRRANPLNHPTVVFRRELALDAGGYQGPDGLEDYDLWARMLIAGARFRNLPDELVLFRAGPQLHRRRRGRELLNAERALQANLHEYGLTTRLEQATNLAVRNSLRLLPPAALRFASRRIYR